MGRHQTTVEQGVLVETTVYIEGQSVHGGSTGHAPAAPVSAGTVPYGIHHHQHTSSARHQPPTVSPFGLRLARRGVANQMALADPADDSR